MDAALLVTWLKSLNGRRWFRILLWAGIAVLPLLFFYSHVRYYMPFLSDDSLISLRYAERLLQGHGLTWTDGHRVEGYSNLLWVLCCAGLGALGFDLVAAARILGFLCMAGVPAAALFWFTKAFPGRSPLFLLPGFAGFAFSGTMAIWAIGGLEQPLIAFLLAWSLAFGLLMFRSKSGSGSWGWLLSLCLGLLAVTRPDGPLFTAGIILSVWLNGLRTSTIKRMIQIAALPVLFYGGQLIFRYIYYGEWVPNTALVKISPSDTHLAMGLRYVWLAFTTHLPLSLAGTVLIIILIGRRQTRAAAMPLLMTAGIWLLYLVFIGGDIFLAFRHMVPVMTVLVFILILGSVTLWDGLARPGWRTGLVLAGLVTLAVFHGQQFRYENRFNKKAVYERWEWDGKTIGLFLRQVFGSQQPLLAVDAAGALPFWSGLPCVDMLGLNDYYIPRHAPEDFGSGRIGHELGDGDYVLGRNPDLIMFAIPPGLFITEFRSGRDMLADPRFYEQYTRVHFLTGEGDRQVLARFWARMTSDKIGIRQEGGDIVIPAFLFSSEPEAPAFLAGSGNLTVALTDTMPLVLENIQLPRGQWTGSVWPSRAGIQVSVMTDDSGKGTVRVETSGPSRMAFQEIRLALKK
ncbi:hypothetical protein JW948_02235 [bacterium]|nr:hypothetical protein [bacterium]